MKLLRKIITKTSTLFFSIAIALALILNINLTASKAFADDKSAGLDYLAGIEFLGNSSWSNIYCPINPISNVMSKAFLIELNKLRETKKLVNLIPDQRSQCEAQKVNEFILNSLHNAIILDTNKLLVLSSYQKEVAFAGTMPDMLPSEVLKQAIKDPNFIGLNRKYSRVGIGFGFDPTMPNAPGFSAWVLIFMP